MYRNAGFAAAVLLAGVFSVVCADTLWVHGTVRTAAAGNAAISGSVVTVTVGFGGNQRVVSDTTDAAGLYSINTATFAGGGGGFVSVTAAATGFTTSQPWTQTLQINNQPDTLSHDFALQPGGTQQADSLYVTGVVTRTGGAAVAGAVVTINLISATVTVSAADTTNDSGRYSIAMVNTGASRNAAIIVAAAGYDTANANVVINNPADGTADRITRNFTLTAIVWDTLTVTGTVRDSANNNALQGALGVVSFVTGGGIGGTTVRDTGVTLANGTFTLDIVVRQGQVPANVNWTAEKTGYASKSGRATVTNGAANIGTVLLVAYAATDSLTYAITGRVTNELGFGQTGVQLFVVMTNNGVVVFRDTVTTNAQGRYTSTTRQPYRTADNVVALAGQVTGYAPVSEQSTTPSSTNAITIDAQLVALTAVAPSAAPAARATVKYVMAYSLSGRLLGTWSASRFNLTELRGLQGAQAFVVRYLSDRAVVNEVTIPAR
jgi:hypothetical protein